jgi:hypothetical protein
MCVSAAESATLGVSSTSLIFTAVEGGASPSSQTIQITNGGGGTMSWSVSDDQAWLSATPATGTTKTETDSVSVSVDTFGLTAAGSPYAGTFTIDSPDAANTPQLVSVMLTITPADDGCDEVCEACVDCVWTYPFGWCHDDQSCHEGTDSGPGDGTTCSDWVWVPDCVR